MIAPAGLRSVMVIALTALLATSSTPGDVVVPEEQQNPSASHIADSVVVWSTEGSVVSVSSTEEDGEETVVTLRSDILFAFASAELGQEAVAAIGQLSAEIPAGTAVAVTGHTDAVGADADNVTLSQSRAEAVATAIGRSDLTLDISGRGEAEPIASNSDAEGQQQNRRVEIRYAG